MGKPRHSTSKTQSSVLSPQSFQKGFTLLELIVVISVVAILAGLFLSRVPFYQEQAEKVAVEQIAGAIQSALVMRTGTLLAHGEASDKELGALVNDNPINWLQQKPWNYAGEFFDPTAQTVTPGHWMFDLKSRELIYVMDHSEYFTPGNDGQKWIRFHVRLEYESSIMGAGKQHLASLLFKPTETYHWFD